jgi:hypothetical protein
MEARISDLEAAAASAAEENEVRSAVTLAALHQWPRCAFLMLRRRFAKSQAVRRQQLLRLVCRRNRTLKRGIKWPSNWS